MPGPLSPQLRLAVVEALGPMSHLLPGEKLEEQLPKLLPGVLALYKKHAEAFHVSKVPTGQAGPEPVLEDPSHTGLPWGWPRCSVGMQGWAVKDRASPSPALDMGTLGRLAQSPSRKRQVWRPSSPLRLGAGPVPLHLLCLGSWLTA